MNPAGRPPTPPEIHLARYKVDENGCWIWQGPVLRGYGRFKSAGKSIAAHRFFYESLVGPIPSDLVIDHICFVTRCVNPRHLRVLTRSENSRRQRRSFNSHCANGHEWTAENTRREMSGKRRCRVCTQRTNRKYEAKRGRAELLSDERLGDTGWAESSARALVVDPALVGIVASLQAGGRR